MAMTTTGKPRLWVHGDWNAFFGFGANILITMLMLNGVMRALFNMPDSLVLGRILPAAGLMVGLGALYNAWLAYRLAAATGRSDVCALPSGISVPHLFVVLFVVMFPILVSSKDPIQAWEAGLAWVFIQSLMLIAGGFLAPLIRRITPRAALLGSLAGIAITFIAMRPVLEMAMTPVIGVVCFILLLVDWLGGLRYFKGVPATLVAIAVGTIIAWGSTLFGLHYGGLGLGGVKSALSSFGIFFPVPAVGHVFGGFQHIGILLATAIPFGLYDLLESIDNVESAEAAGDSFPATRVLTGAGVVSLIGCLMGSPFITTVYVGHPGWKSMGGRIGYSAAAGLGMIVLCCFGVIGLVTTIVPVVAILPILLYLALLVGAQAFQKTPARHAPAIILALLPQLAAWGKTLVDGTLGALGIDASSVSAEQFGGDGVFYEGLRILGGGATLSGIVLGAVAVFIIEREFVKAAAFAAAGAVFTFFGLMHAAAAGIGLNSSMTASYVAVAIILLASARFSQSASAQREPDR